MKNFNLPEALQESLHRLGFIEPTPIQKQAIPVALDGRDILGSAQTGTGKTGAFVIPILAKIMNSPTANALILTPTRELATQVLKVIHSLAPRKSGLNTALLIGGEAFQKQLRDLKNTPRLIVGTPGRINDHIERGTLRLNNTAFLVLDETDRMLDMGFGIQLDAIIKHLPKARQTLMFSATMPANILKLSAKYLIQPEQIAIGKSHQTAINVSQEVVHMKHAAKYEHLIKELDQREGSVIVFVKTKRGADELADQLCEDHHSADAIHGDLRQRERNRVIEAFRNKRHRIMVATDVAARGLDIPHIEHVINYDLPQSPEDYIHRIGRTGRAGATGTALSFVSPAEVRMWRDITRLLDGHEIEGDTAPARAPRREPFKSNKSGFKFKARSSSSAAPSHKRERSHSNHYSGNR